MRKLYVFVVMAALLGSTLAGCAPAPTAAPQAPAAAVEPAATAAPAATAVPTEDPEAAKIAGAKAEGQLVSYGMSDDWVNLGNIWKTLEQRYSVVHTDTDMTSAEEITHLLAEKDAPVMDVADIGFDFVGTLVENNLAMSYKNTSWDKIPANFKDSEGRWAVAYWGAIAFLVNTDLVKDAPHTWDDLLKPEYKDMICSRDPSKSTYATGSVLAAAYAHGGDEFERSARTGLFQDLARQRKLASRSRAECCFGPKG